MNVAFGGSLWQKLQEVPGHLDHREDLKLPLEQQYDLAHEVVLEPGGLLRRLAGTDRIRVNSLHGQGVRELGAGLAVEARAPDGVIEAFRVRAGRAVRACGAVASGMASHRQPLFTRAVRRVRRRLPRPAMTRPTRNTR